jgi:hypothetical protein
MNLSAGKSCSSYLYSVILLNLIRLASNCIISMKVKALILLICSFSLPMGYDSDSDPPIYSGMPGKKLGILVGVIALGSFFAVQAMFGFPIKDLVRNEVTEESKVVIKDQQGTCIVEASDHQPRGIPNCPYNVGDTLIITFKKGTAPIEKYYLKR